MIALLPRPTKCKWGTVSFASTLYLGPILDLLVAKVPPDWQAEIRLGLQEALVNAAKHGNQLDPGKTIAVQYAIMSTHGNWVITDHGAGFIPNCCCQDNPDSLLPADNAETGRGLCILYQIFDHVHWNDQGTQLKLTKNRR
ncbi:MAG: ATP-binding protein [Cyanobacteria bacterium SW_9_44_58]|nr:MAG: ATP-binding protein [Cyanobacteria bacterium SW_9_44_58]